MFKATAGDESRSLSTSRMSLDSIASSTIEVESDANSDAEDRPALQGAGTADTVLNAQDTLKRSLQGLQDFFKFHKLESSKESQKYGDKQLHKGMANCQKCGQTIKYDSESRGNLKKHYNRCSWALECIRRLLKVFL